MRKVLIAIVGLVIVLVAAVLVVPSLIDWNGYKPEIQAAARDATGRELKIDGDLSLSILPSPTLSVADVSLANVEGGSTPNMASLESLDVSVALIPLLSGDIRVTSVTLVKPVITLETLPDGRVNWAFDSGPSAEGGAGDAPSEGGDAPALAIDEAVIEDGRLVYRDASTGAEHTLSDVNLEISAGGLKGPFEIDGSVGYQGVPLTLAASVGALDAGRAAPVKLTATGQEGAIEVALNGTVDMDAGPAFKGRLEAKAPDLAKAAEIASTFGADAPSGMPANAASVSADVDGSPQSVKASNLVVTLGDSRFQGEVTAALDPKLSIDATLSGNRLDLDALLPQDGASDDAKPAAADSASAQPPTAPSGTKTASGAAALPTDIDARIDLKIDAVQYNGAAIRNVQVDASLRDGVGDLRLATAQLPGGTDVTLIGGLESGPSFVGRLEAASDNLRATLDWLQVDLTSVPADRLRKAVVSAAIRASGEEIQVSDWTMELDATKAQGGLTLALRDRPAFGLSLAVDRINVDAYLPQGDSPAAASGGTSGGAQPAAGGGSDNAEALAVLDSFDANIDLRVGEATVGGITLADARIDALLQNGTLTLRKASVGDMAGAAGTISGVLKDAARQPSVDMSFDVSVKDADRFARLLSTDSPVPAKQLGTVALKGTASGDMSDVKLDAQLTVAGGTLDVAGTAQPLTSPPTVNVTYKLQHPDANRLVSTLSPGALAGFGSLGTLQVDGELTTRDDGRYANKLAAYTGGGRLDLVGNMDLFAATPDVNMKIVVSHPNAADAIRLASPGYRAQGGNPGAFEASTLLNGPVDGLTLSETSIVAGPIRISGSGSIANTGARPHISLALTSNRIAVDPWLPPGSSSPQGAAPAAAPTGGSGAGGGWSREKIDTSGLSAVDADVTMDIEAIEYGSYVVDNAQLAAAVKDGVLRVSKLTGGMFGGTFDLTAMLADRPTPEAAVTVKVRNADVRQAAKTAAETDVVSGILTYDTDLKATGGSEYELVSNLNGTGSFEVRDGTVKGFDLRAFSDRLKELNGATDFLDLTQRALSGGQTAFSALTGSYTVQQGVLRSNDIALNADAAKGSATAVLDLPPRQMDVNAKARLTDHPNAPPVGMRLVGSFDNPRQILDIDEMQRYVVQTLGTRTLKQLDKSGTVEKLDNLLNGGAAGGTTGGTDSGTPDSGSAAPAPQDPKKQLEDAAKGLLQNLLKK
ncbi:AsmA family protein [Thalassobaculum sp. OXR-137]|uniref:AsmA family protein n=1 Tax=Thalassobaculum sp. OXR-137 TaxID=3100173 RepID=UPI002AC9870C|nr:AsmA family protein [Thalassobaculum sp. OXR-137]WPZ34346.1 AsmA family protein [Thalassobaculum sp. OXR-137]